MNSRHKDRPAAPTGDTDGLVMERGAVANPAPDNVPKRVLNARIRNFRGKTLVAVNNEILELTETAAVVWKAIDGTRTVRDISLALTAEYDVDNATALADVAELLGDLHRAGLLEY